MFDLFFLKYKESFHKGSIKNITVFEYVILAVLLVSACILISQAFFQMTSTVFGIALLVMIADTAVMFVYEKRKATRGIDAKTQNYKTNVIEALVNLLKQSTYDLYSVDGLTWLISCCEKNIKHKEVVSLGPTIFPIFTLAYGIFIKDMTSNDVMAMTLTIIIMISVLSLFNKYVFSYIRETFENPDRDLYKCLINELEYIKIQLIAHPEYQN